MTGMEWFEKQLASIRVIEDTIIKESKGKDEQRIYDIQCYWYGRGIAAAKEDKIKEYAPKKPE